MYLSKKSRGVANVDIFSGDELVGTATTLTDSSLTIGLSTEDIRGGQGAALLGRYFHTSTFELTLTDALFDLNYIAWSVGAELEDGSDILFNEQLTAAAAGSLTLSHAAKPLGGCNDGATYGWYRLASEPNGEWNRGTVDGTTLSGADIAENSVYCVKYFYTENAAKKIRVKADYIPDTLHLVLKENLYAGGDMSGSSSTKVGYLVIDIPRFQLDGSQDLSMSMTGASTTSLKGSALRSEGCESGCEDGGYYAVMSQVLSGAKWYDGIAGLAVDGGSVKIGEAMKVYATFGNKVPRLIDMALLNSTTEDDHKAYLTVNGEKVISLNPIKLYDSSSEAGKDPTAGAAQTLRLFVPKKSGEQITDDKVAEGRVDVLAQA